jgi:hypothetical protein
MPNPSPRRSLAKRIALVVAGLLAFTLVWVAAVRLAVENIYRGIETQKASGLSAIAGPFSSYSVDSDSTTWGSTWISKSASVHMHAINFDQSVQGLYRIVAAHHSYLEDLRTESRPGHGRALSANVSMPSTDFDTTLSDLKTLGRIDAISQAGEDSAVKLATAKRHLTAAQTNLARLQKLQGERKGELRDAVALEKEIAQANEAVAEAERQHDGLISTVARAHIKVTLMEDYRASMETNWAGAVLGFRNSLVAGMSAIISSLSLFLGGLFEYGLPLLFWFALLFVPARSMWRRFRRSSAVVAEAQ